MAYSTETQHVRLSVPIVKSFYRESKFISDNVFRSFRSKSYSSSLMRHPRPWLLVDIFIEHVSSLEFIHRALICVCFIYYAFAQYGLSLSVMFTSSGVQPVTKLMIAAVRADTWSAALIFFVWMYGIHWVASAPWGVKTVVIMRRSLVDMFRIFVSALPLIAAVVHCAFVRNVSCGSSRSVSSLSHVLYDLSFVSSSIVDKNSIASLVQDSTSFCHDFQWFWMFVAFVFRLLLLPCFTAATALQMFCPLKGPFSPIYGLADPEVRWRTLGSFTAARGQYYFIPWFRWPQALLQRALRSWATSPDDASLYARRAVALSLENRRPPPSPFEQQEEEQFVSKSEVLVGMGSTLRALARIDARFMHRVDIIEQTIQSACEKLLESAELLRAHSVRPGKHLTIEEPRFPSAVLTDADIIRGELTLEYFQNKSKFDVQLALPYRRFNGMSKSVHELGKATERFCRATDAFKSAKGLAKADASFRRKGGIFNLPGSLN